MTKPEKFEDFAVWQQARNLVPDIYELTRKDLFAKDFGLRSQIQRAVVSIPSNIAEGYERNSNRELLRFLFIAKGSAGEVRSQLYNAKDLGYITDVEFEAATESVRRLSIGIYNWIKSIQQSGFAGSRYNPLDDSVRNT